VSEQILTQRRKGAKENKPLRLYELNYFVGDAAGLTVTGELVAAGVVAGV
jgi:hypothetical protein